MASGTVQVASTNKLYCDNKLRYVKSIAGSKTQSLSETNTSHSSSNHCKLTCFRLMFAYQSCFYVDQLVKGNAFIQTCTWWKHNLSLTVKKVNILISEVKVLQLEHCSKPLNRQSAWSLPIFWMEANQHVVTIEQLYCISVVTQREKFIYASCEPDTHYSIQRQN